MLPSLATATNRRPTEKVTEFNKVVAGIVVEAAGCTVQVIPFGLVSTVPLAPTATNTPAANPYDTLLRSFDVTGVAADQVTPSILLITVPAAPTATKTFRSL